MKTNPQPPKHLSPASKAFFDDVADEFDLSASHVKILTAACESMDLCESARAAIATDGLFGLDRYGQRRQHPGIAVERDARISMVRCLKELGLPGEPDAPEVPTRRWQNGSYV